MRISDWSSDVCSSDLLAPDGAAKPRMTRLPPFGSRLRLRIGLLGGSFNPAHAAHREISLTALHRLKLDQVWWLVSPQNPLKAANGMAPLSARMAGAATLSAHPKILVPDEIGRAHV